MKKKLVALLLCTCVIVSLCAVIGSSAYADDVKDETKIQHVVEANDNYWNLCIKNHLTYDVCKEAIMILNGYTNESQLNLLNAGKTIYLPASDEAAKEIISKKDEQKPEEGGKPEEGKEESKPEDKKDDNVKTGTVVYYIVSHVMSPGEIVDGIYKSWKLDYKPYEKQILGLNNMNNFNHMYSNRAYLFPVPSVPTGCTAAYSVIAHKVQAGELAYQICASYGLNYFNIVNLIKALNGGSDLSIIHADQVIYLPVPGNGGKGDDPVNPSATSYKINLMSTTNGGFIAAVGAAPASSVAAGTKVNILASANPGHTVGDISVVKADDPKVSVTVTSNSFTMPEYDVNISVSFK